MLASGCGAIKLQPAFLHGVLGVAAIAALAGCNFTNVRSATGGTRSIPTGLVEQASFEHRCSADRIVHLRDLASPDAPWTIDLDVCGRVRRYRCRASGCADVTRSFPPDALPPPVQPPSGPGPAAAPERPQGSRPCVTSSDCISGMCVDGSCRI